MVKKMPMESSIPEFWNVARVPEATPRAPAGTEFMIQAVFGERKPPIPRPITTSTAANSG